MIYTKQKNYLENGFSAIELLVSLFVASALVLGFYQLFNVIDQGNAIAKNNVTANNLALSNLSKFPNTPEDMPACASVPSTGYMPTLDITEDKTNGLPGSVEQKIRIFCTQRDGISKIVTSVTYGPSTERITVKQVTYIDAAE